MTTFYKRYLDGENEAVWKELTQSGSDIRSDRLRSDVNDVAKIIVERAYNNLCLIHRRLLDLGYQFDDPEAALLQSSPADVRLLDGVEQQFGIFPVILRAWYERVASVNFSQAHSQLHSEGNEEQRTAISVAGLGLNPVLVFLSLPRCVAMHKRLMEEEQEQESVSWLSTLLPTGGWASNCNPKGFHLPDRRFDGVLYNEGVGDVYFVQELREAFAWGGFPFWRLLLYRKRFASPLRRNPDFANVLPILADGLLSV